MTTSKNDRIHICNCLIPCEGAGELQIKGVWYDICYDGVECKYKHPTTKKELKKATIKDLKEN